MVAKEEVFVCPKSVVPSAVDLPAGVSLTSVQGAGTLDTALKKVMKYALATELNPTNLVLLYYTCTNIHNIILTLLSLEEE